MAGSIESVGTAVWSGDLQTGEGKTSVESGSFRDVSYSFNSRFEKGPGTTPEELIAASHASCFSMALSKILGEGGNKPERIQTRATLSLQKTDTGFKISRIQLVTEASVPGMDPSKFREAAEKAKENCPVSVLLKPGLEELSLDAKLG